MQRIFIFLLPFCFFANFQCTLSCLHPHVTSFSPSDNSQSVPVDSPITFSFSEKVDHTTVEKGLKLIENEKPVPFDLETKNSINFKLTPKEPLKKGVSYQAQFLTDIVSAKGIPIEEGVFVFYTYNDKNEVLNITSSYPDVYYLTPIDLKKDLVVSFNTKLLSNQPNDLLRDKIVELVPNIPGEIQISGNNLIYKLRKPLSVNTEYVFRINKGLAFSNGQTFESTWSNVFKTTPSPKEITQKTTYNNGPLSSPLDATDIENVSISIKPKWVMTFSESMDTISTEKSIHLGNVGLIYLWKDSNKTLEITTATTLPYDNYFILEISDDALAASNDGNHLNENYRYHFHTNLTTEGFFDVSSVTVDYGGTKLPTYNSSAFGGVLEMNLTGKAGTTLEFDITMSALTETINIDDASILFNKKAGDKLNSVPSTQPKLTGNLGKFTATYSSSSTILSTGLYVLTIDKVKTDKHQMKQPVQIVFKVTK